jgi:hypothetical protein
MLAVFASSALAFGRPAWMKRALVSVASGLLRCARNDGERTAEASPRLCEELLRRSNPVFRRECTGRPVAWMSERGAPMRASSAISGTPRADALPPDGAALIRATSWLRGEAARCGFQPATNASITPLAAAGGTTIADPLRIPTAPTALSAAARSPALSTKAAPPRSGRPASETPGNCRAS